MLIQKSKIGLRIRPSYEQLMNAIVDNDILNLKKTPNVFDANWLMSTPQMTQIRKDALLDVQNLELQREKQELLNMKAKEIARETGVPTAVAKEKLKPRPTVEHYDISDGDKVDEAKDAAYDDMVLDETDRKRKAGEKIERAVRRVREANMATAPHTIAHEMASASSSSSSHQAPMPKAKGRPGKKLIVAPEEVKPIEVEAQEFQNVLENKKTSKKGTIKQPLKKPTREEKQEKQIKNLEKELNQMKAVKAKIKRQEERKQKQERQQNPMTVNDEETQQKRNADESTPKPRKKTKQEKTQSLPSSSSSGEPEQADNKVEHGVKLDDNKTKSYWKGKPIQYIKEQAQLRGHRFTNLEMKGGTKAVKGKIEKVKKFGKQDYLEVLFKILKI